MKLYTYDSDANLHHIFCDITKTMSKTEILNCVIDSITHNQVDSIFSKKLSLEQCILRIEYLHDSIRVERIFHNDNGEVRSTGMRHKTELYLYTVLKDYDIFDLYFKLN